MAGVTTTTTPATAYSHTELCRAMGGIALDLACGGVRAGNGPSLPEAVAEQVRERLQSLALAPADVSAIAEAYVSLLAEPPASQTRNPSGSDTVADHESNDTVINRVSTVDGRKRSGSYYTPAPLVERTLDATLTPLLEACTTADELLALRILDPACGSGHFLCAAHRRLAERLGELRKINGAEALAEPRLLDCVHGWERDPFTAHVCEIRLRNAAGEASASLVALPRTVVVRDALLDEATPEQTDAGFDAVVGNPPWISYAGRHAVPEDAATLERLVARFPAIRAWKAAHSAFLLRSLELVRPGGRVGLVLPLQVRYHARYRPVRDAVTSQCASVAVYDEGEQAFVGVEQATGRFHFERAHPHEATLAPCDEWSLSSAAGCSKTRDPLEHLVQHLREMAKMPKEMFSDPGVHTGNVSRKVIRTDTDPEVLAQPQRFAPVREGRDIQAYHCAPARKRLWHTPTLAAGEYCRVRPLTTYAAVPILVRQTASRPIAARHCEPGYFRNSLLACWGHDEFEVEVLLAVLNSALLACYHRLIHGDATQRTFPQVKVRHLRDLPRFDLGRLTPSRRRRLVEQVHARERVASGSDEALRLDEGLEVDVLALYGLPAGSLELLRQTPEPLR